MLRSRFGDRFGFVLVGLGEDLVEAIDLGEDRRVLAFVGFDLSTRSRWGIVGVRRLARRARPVVFTHQVLVCDSLLL